MRYQAMFDMDKTPQITDEAVSYLKDNLSDEGEIFVGFSGGKDSICTAELFRLSGLPYQLYYSFTGIDAPDVVQFIRKYYPECIFLKPKRTFWRDLSVNVPPSDRLRWCCTSLKKKSSWDLPHKLRSLGIRAEESSKRANRKRTNIWKEKDHVYYQPIFHWKEWQVWDFINKNKLPYPKLYDEGFDRIGCVVCPYHSEPTGRMHKMYRDRWPGFFKKYESAISDLFYKRISQGKQMFYNTPQEFCDAWYKKQSARWYK